MLPDETPPRNRQQTWWADEWARVLSIQPRKRNWFKLLGRQTLSSVFGPIRMS